MREFVRKPASGQHVQAPPFARRWPFPGRAARDGRTASTGTAHDSSIAPKHATPTPRIQPKLTIGATNNPLEREADSVADQVMRMPDSSELIAGIDQVNSSSSVQRTPCTDQRGKGPFDIVVVGAPAPGEIAAQHPYQFEDAARYRGVTANTVWIVEQTGYSAGQVPTGKIESDISAGCLIWLTPQTSLTSIINDEFPDASIASMTVFSHGLPSIVVLRYGWTERGLPNYGLTIEQVHSVARSKFLPGAQIEFDSCNSGTDTGAGTLAQEMADQTGIPTRAWTGRTSYAEVNNGPDDGDVSVHESLMWRRGPDFTEMYSRLLGRTPVLKTFEPFQRAPIPRHGKRVDGFNSYVNIKARLPETEHFQVPEKGIVVVTCSRGEIYRPDRHPLHTDLMGIYLRKLRNFWFDSNTDHRIVHVNASDDAVFTNVEAGEYYLEFTVHSTPINSGETMYADIDVNVYES